MANDFDPASAVQAASSGDHEAWESLVDHYGGPVRAVTAKFGLSGDESEPCWPRGQRSTSPRRSRAFAGSKGAGARAMDHEPNPPGRDHHSAAAEVCR